MFKEVNKVLNFDKSLDYEKIPFYSKDYIYDSEEVLASYMVGQDICLITDKKIVLFENSGSSKERKSIISLPYHIFLSHGVVFYSKSAEIAFQLKNGQNMTLKFSNLDDSEKMKIRFLYNAISATICGQEVPKKVKKRLLENDFVLV